ncbi:8655_t:CDS:2 [Funneliformis mosseae]|uniref:8655_t:CDS:1 n=1 Tax=Funneliformis mosseae TaxID=27381 RepID=A0A9N9H1Y6_FUNMO|nr:8655_t:CDS:2 [Funneliformis mosseae]
MYSESNIIEMETSLNCVVLSDKTSDSLDTFSIDFYKKNDNKIITELRNKSYDFDKFKVDQLGNYICDRNNIPNSGGSAVKLWKVNIVDEVDIKEKLKDETNV